MQHDFFFAVNLVNPLTRLTDDTVCPLRFIMFLCLIIAVAKPDCALCIDNLFLLLTRIVMNYPLIIKIISD